MRTRVLALLTAFTAFVAVTLGFAEVAQAADLPPDVSWIDIAKPVLDAAISGSPALALAVALVAAVALVRKFGSTPAGAPRWPWVMTDVGGTALTFLGSLGAAFAAALSGGALPSLALLWTALTVAAGASGGYTAVRRLVVPALRWLVSKIPERFARVRKIAGAIVTFALYFFENGTKNVAKAEAAGEAAVQAAPAPGVSKVVRVGKSFP